MLKSNGQLFAGAGVGVDLSGHAGVDQSNRRILSFLAHAKGFKAPVKGGVKKEPFISWHVRMITSLRIGRGLTWSYWL